MSHSPINVGEEGSTPAPSVLAAGAGRVTSRGGRGRGGLRRGRSRRVIPAAAQAPVPARRPQEFSGMSRGRVPDDVEPDFFETQFEGASIGGPSPGKGKSGARMKAAMEMLEKPVPHEREGKGGNGIAAFLERVPRLT